MTPHACDDVIPSNHSALHYNAGQDELQTLESCVDIFSMTIDVEQPYRSNWKRSRASKLYSLISCESLSPTEGHVGKWQQQSSSPPRTRTQSADRELQRRFRSAAGTPERQSVLLAPRRLPADPPRRPRGGHELEGSLERAGPVLPGLRGCLRRWRTGAYRLHEHIFTQIRTFDTTGRVTPESRIIEPSPKFGQLKIAQFQQNASNQQEVPLDPSSWTVPNFESACITSEKDCVRIDELKKKRF